MHPIFQEKFRKFTSPTLGRKEEGEGEARDPQEARQEDKTLKEKLVSALR